MAMDWTVKKNFGKGMKIQGTPKETQGAERLTIIMTKQQKATIQAYCKREGLELSTLMRNLIGDYFNKVGFTLQSDQAEDTNQLKMFKD